MNFDEGTLAAAQHDLVVGVQAGVGNHKFTAVWSVVVDRRLFIRSWGLADRSWFQAFRKQPVGKAQIAGEEFEVRAIHTRSERVLNAVDRAYREKYNTPASAAYVEDMTSEKSRNTTTELVPRSPKRG